MMTLKMPPYPVLLAVLLMGLQGAHADIASPLTLVVEPPAGGASLDTLLDPNAGAWQAVPKQPVKLNRTPPLYEGDPTDDGYRPTAFVQLVQLDNQTLLLRCHWSDGSEDALNEGATHADAGADHIYTKHTVATDQFPDALCVMVPKTRGAHATYPSPMMGDVDAPVELYYWRAGKGFECLDAHGRATTGPATGENAQPAPLQGQFVRDSDGWSVVMAIPNVTAQTPLCLAIWDGAKMHRDGLKFFSLWYEVQPKEASS